MRRSAKASPYGCFYEILSMSDRLYDWNIDRLSACSIPIVGWSGDNEVGIATGFTGVIATEFS